jgi:hypothetical protein
MREEVDALTGGYSEDENAALGKRSIDADGGFVLRVVDTSFWENIVASTSY